MAILCCVAKISLRGTRAILLENCRIPVLRILCEFFIEPPPDIQRKERQGTGHGKRQRKRNMGL
jgi:hypothetical protein